MPGSLPIELPAPPPTVPNLPLIEFVWPPLIVAQLVLKQAHWGRTIAGQGILPEFCRRNLVVTHQILSYSHQSHRYVAIFSCYDVLNHFFALRKDTASVVAFL